MPMVLRVRRYLVCGVPHVIETIAERAGAPLANQRAKAASF